VFFNKVKLSNEKFEASRAGKNVAIKKKQRHLAGEMKNID
jgi:hypothetical protein